MPEMTATDLHGPGSLDHLLDPVSRDTFLAEHWGRRHLVVHRGDRSYYGRVFGLADVDRYLEVASRDPEATLSLGNAQTGPRTVALSALTPRQVYARLSAGDSLMIPGIQRYWPAAAAFARRLAADLGAQVKLNAYVTPPGNQGAPIHPDVQDVFAVQLEGVKDWAIYDAFAYDPVGSLEYSAFLPRSPFGEAEPLAELRLHAGDLLYIPRGLLHRAMAPEGSPSLHLAVCVTPVYQVDLLKAALELASVTHPEALARPLHPGFPEDPEARRAVAEDFAEALRRFAEVADLDAAADLMSRARGAASRLPADGHVEQILRLDGLSLASIAERRPGLTYRVQRHGDKVALHYGPDSLDLPAPLEPVIEWMGQGERFAVGDLPDALGDDGKATLVRRLVAAGFLRVVDLPGTAAAQEEEG